MAKYMLTLVFLGLLTILFYYPTPGIVLEKEIQYNREDIKPEVKTVKEVLAAETLLEKDTDLADAQRYDASLTLQ